MQTTSIPYGQPDTGKPLVRFDEGKVASTKQRRGARLHKKAIMIFLVAMSVGIALADSRWVLDSLTPTWWFTESAWDTYPVAATDSVTLTKLVGNPKASIYLRDGDDVTVVGVTPVSDGYSGSQLLFQVQEGAKFTFTGTFSSTEKGSTNTFDFAGGTVRGNSFQPGPHVTSMNYVYITNGADVAFAAMALGRLGPVDLYVEDSTFAVTNGNPTLGRTDGAFSSRWFAKRATIGGRSPSVQQNGQMLWEDSTASFAGFSAAYPGGVVRLTNTVVSAASSSITLGNKDKTPGDAVEFELVGDNTLIGTLTQLAIYNNVSYVQRGGTVNLTRDANDLNAMVVGTTSGATAEQNFSFYGGTLNMTNLQVNGGACFVLSGCGKSTARQYGGTVNTYGVYFNATGSETPRYEIYGGTLCARGYVGNQQAAGIMEASSTTTKSGVFAIYGGAPSVHLQRVGSYNVTTRQPQIDFVICTNGVPTIVMDVAPASVCNWVDGYFTIRPLGGVQLLHQATVTLLDATVSQRNLTCQNLDAGGTLLPNASLWSPGATSSTRKLSVSLLASAELEQGTYYSDGKSSGYLTLPQINTASVQSVSVFLELAVQGATTLAELVDGFHAAGYAATALENGDYNVKIDIPVPLIEDQSENEKVVFDFNVYPDAESIRDATPTVQALVKRANIEKQGLGTIILLK